MDELIKDLEDAKTINVPFRLFGDDKFTLYPEFILGWKIGARYMIDIKFKFQRYIMHKQRRIEYIKQAWHYYRAKCAEDDNYDPHVELPKVRVRIEYQGKVIL